MAPAHTPGGRVRYAGTIGIAGVARAHASIGVFAAISVATATRLPGSPAAASSLQPSDGRYLIEHPTGAMEVLLDMDDSGRVCGAGSVRTARKLVDGLVFGR